MTEDRRRRLLSLTGVLPLGAYVVFHLFETASATGGRRRWAEGLTGAGGGALAVGLETALVLLPLAAHAALGLFGVARDRRPSAAGYRSPAMRGVARATGVGLLGFLIFHLAHTWVAKLGGMDAAALYDHLNDSVGRPLHLLVYVFGVTCVAFHLALGLGAFAATWGIARTDAGRRAARAVGVVVGVAVWLVSLNTLSHFAVGRAVFGASVPESTAEASP